MDSDVLFTERQKFNQWWLWFILLGTNGFLLFGVYKQVIGGERFGNNPMSNVGLLFVLGLTVVLSVIFLNFRLETIIKKDGINVRFFPFHLRFKHYAWQSLNKSYVREYAAIKEYGGWGLRFGFLGKGKAFNVSGNKGLQLEFTNGEKLLIGTNKPDQLTGILNKTGQLRR